MKYFTVESKEIVCSNCGYFYQHFVRTGTGFLACNAGHCCYPRMKDRKPGQVGCGYFIHSEEKGA